MVALLLAVAGQHGRKLGRRQVAGIHRQVDKVARQRHAQAQPRLLVFDKPVERRRGEHVAQRAELGKPREHQAGHGVFLGQRDGCALGAEEALDKRGCLRLSALVAQRRRPRGFIAFGRLRHLPAQREAVLAVHGLRTDVHVLRRFVEVELQLAGNGAVGVYLVRRADLQLRLDKRQRRRAEQRHVPVGNEQGVLVAVVHGTQKVGAARERRRAAVHHVVAKPHVQPPRLLGDADALAALDGPAVFGARKAQRDGGVFAHHAHALNRWRGEIGAVDGEHVALKQVEQLHRFGFRKLQRASHLGRLAAQPCRAVVGRLAHGARALDELRHGARAVVEQGGGVRERQLLAVSVRFAAAHALGELAERLHHIRRARRPRDAKRRRPQAVAERQLGVQAHRAGGRVLGVKRFGALHELGDAGRRLRGAVRLVAHERVGALRKRQRQRHAVLAHAVVFAKRRARARVVHHVAGVLVECHRRAVAVIPSAA